MPVSNSATDIVNLSLDLIKTENINDVEMPGTDKIAAVANRWYDDVRQTALEAFPWNFATKRDAIPLNATAPDFGFDDAYVFPNDYISLTFIKYWWIPLSQWNYVIENQNLYIDNGGSDTLNIGYVYDMQNTINFSPSFKIYLAYFLAELTVYKLTGNPNLRTAMTNGRKQAELNAKAKNGKANPPVAYRSSRLLNARRTYSGPSSRATLGRPNGRA